MKKYKITYQDENRVKTKIIESSNLKEEKLPSKILTIKPLSEKKDFNIFKSKIKIDKKLLISIFYELNIMLQANLMLNDALSILSQNYKEEKLNKFIDDLKKALLVLDSIDNIFKDYRLDIYIVSFLKLCQKNGNVKVNINAMSILLKEEMKIKKEFSKAIRYPFILLISLFLSINIIFYFVVPKFKIIFINNYDSLPLATKILFNIHTIYMSYFIYLILIFICMVFSIIYIYFKNKEFEYLVSKVIFKDVFFLRDLYSSMELYRMFLVINIMLESNYEFIKALNSSKTLIRNKYLLDKISLIENLLKNGKSINLSFKRANIFDSLVLNLINTAEASNSLTLISKEIKDIYKNRFDEKMKKFISYIEPIFLIIIVSLVLWIILAIFIPIWDMGSMMKN
ncbi:type II secretion system F family protein [Arcobacter roscoffensis]|uniref:Type II secretion system F family protein n=1 Tax=Arcobacter roscoffensis TaxID=2961520 RepID=A0ABY5E1W9_9BACT|nr:type II secretion system F family protein [Arcobacter roscoffensis]UTJ05872.1 type II secretion system F family protein [Arcobacter roscoffensis]